MTTGKEISLSKFDPAEYLDSPEAIEAYINEAAKTGDPAFIANALNVAARARAMNDQ
ncbi:TPA: hypothetical protein N2786_003716 [Vibrio parahaemolyticus]|nr:hypothetical protein [Vibrio parahaemolyticus]